MKNIVLACVLLLFFPTILPAQDKKPFEPVVTLKWAPAGLLAGGINLHAEYNIAGRSSLTAKIGIPSGATRQFEYEGKDVDFTMKATSFLAGYRRYIGRRPMRGLYFEPYFKYLHHTAEGTGTGTIGSRTVTMNFTNSYNGYGIGAQLGAQFLIGKRFTIDLFFLGPEINAAENNLKAVEISSTIPWTQVEAQDAERDIKEFIDQFPFIRKRTNIMVDRDNKTVTAAFKGALPGYRLGVSFGIAL